MVSILRLSLYFFSLGVTLCADFTQLKHLRSRTDVGTQRQTVEELIWRLVEDRSSDFEVEINPSLDPQARDTFEISSLEHGRIKISGTSGVAAAMGFYHYIKYFCYGQRTWAGKQTKLPSTLPVIDKPVKHTTLDRFSYYQNVCTMSYTSAFWSWARWEEEIDWMALHGINLPLAFVGQEAIFQRMFLSMGFTQKDMDGFFGGPAFLAWARMGNIQGWGGPLPQMWITQKLVLQHQILQRMRNFGMITVLPGFSGHVPAAIIRRYPQANVTRLKMWNRFNSTYSGTYLLDFADPLFQKFGQTFIQMQRDEYGTDHIYNADTFNEMQPASSDISYLAQVGKSIYSAMTAADSEAVWMIQGWMFQNIFWKGPQVKALVTSVPQGRMIILDLISERYPQYGKFESYYGQPFIWCMLHNFGGTMELYGDFTSINNGPFKGRNYTNSTMIGTGMTPEGLHQNEIIYEFMAENSWRTKPRDIEIWIGDFLHQRYGQKNQDVQEAWKFLLKSVYNTSHTGPDFDRVMITKRPDPKYNVASDVWYNPEDLFQAWDGYVNASHQLQGSKLFHYDIVDISRNSLQLVALTFFTAMIEAYDSKDVESIKKNGLSLTNLLSDMDQLLCSNERFLVGTWINDAKSWATDGNEKKLLEYNARNQITLWGPDGECHDYASKQWCGVMNDYFRPRWQFFNNWLVLLVQNGSSWDSDSFNKHIFKEVESPWTFDTHPYPTKPSGNTIALCRDLHDKYRSISKDPFFRKTWQAHKETFKSGTGFHAINAHIVGQA